MVSKEEYLNYMQGVPETSGYLTSPLFQEGFEDWNPDAWRNDLAEGARQELGVRGVNLLGGVATETPAPGEYPYPDYDPARWGTEFGHEITHSSIPFSFSDQFSKFMNPTDLQAGQEEGLNRMHDYMYGDYKNWDVSGHGNYLRRQGYLSQPDWTKKTGQRSWQMDFTPKAYEAIRNSNLKDWQKGVMSLGPTTSRGQIARGHTPDQVRAQGEAYMDPDRGSYTAPTMTQQGMRDEATRTGGTVNPHEATRARWTPEQPARGPHDYEKGGSVNPHEETTRAAREYRPVAREYRPVDRGIANVDDRSFFQKGKDVYDEYKPYIPKVRDDMLNWDLGNWNVGVGEGKFNLGYTLPLGGANLKRNTLRSLNKGLDSLNVTDPSDFYMDKIIRDNPEEVMYNLMRQYPTPEMQKYYDQPVDRYQLDFGGTEIDKWIGENPGSTMGDLYDYLPELGVTGPGDFWPGGAEI